MNLAWLYWFTQNLGKKGLVDCGLFSIHWLTNFTRISIHNPDPLCSLLIDKTLLDCFSPNSPLPVVGGLTSFRTRDRHGARPKKILLIFIDQPFHFSCWLSLLYQSISIISEGISISFMQSY